MIKLKYEKGLAFCYNLTRCLGKPFLLLLLIGMIIEIYLKVLKMTRTSVLRIGFRVMG